MAEISYFTDKRKSLLNEFYVIKEEGIEKKIKKIESILNENNTEEDFLIEYLKLKLILLHKIKGNKEIDNQDKEKVFLLDLEKYEIGVSKNTFNNNFGNYFLKQSAYEKIIDLFMKIQKISNEKTEEGRLIKIIEILEMKNNKYEQTFPISYSVNKELYFNSLLYYLKKHIKNYYLDEKLNYLDEKIIDKKKKDYENKIIEINNSEKYTVEQKKKKIEELNIIINNINICFCKNFFSFIKSLSKFISKLFISFTDKFENNSSIFKTDKYDNNQKSDIYLFSDFIFFLIRFNFTNQISHYIEIWKETFSKNSNLNKKDFDSLELNLQYMNNDLNITYKNNGDKEDEEIIKNIDYYIPYLIDEIIKNPEDKIDIFETMKYLKIDKYYSSIFIKSNWEKISDYIIEILLSPTIQEIYSEIDSSIKRVALNKDDMRKILDDLHYFNFKTNFVAETKKRFLFVYIQASLTSENDYDLNVNKVLYLVIFLITCIHEIIGHLYIRINNYLNKDEKITSPMPNFPSKYAEERGKESGEVIEEKLFGNYKFEMTMKEILFTLDKENYKKGLIEFQKNFQKANEIEINNISNDLKNILNNFGISLAELKVNSKYKYSVNRSKNQNKFRFPQHHSLLQIDSDDD